MGAAGGTAPMALGLFLLTWVVMMAAMMLPAAASVVLAVDRWARRSGRSRLAAAGFIAGYLADWSAAGLGAYAVLAGLEHRYPSPGPAAVRAGAALLVVAGLWQLTPSSTPACAGAEHPWPSSPPAPADSPTAGSPRSEPGSGTVPPASAAAGRSCSSCCCWA